MVYSLHEHFWQLQSPLHPHFGQSEVWTDEATAALQDSIVTSHISKCVVDVVITETIKSFPIQKAQMNGEVRAYPEPKNLLFGQVTRKHTTPPK